VAERVAVVIVNWNGLQHLRTCIPAVLAQDYPDFQVVVVDNGSTDGSGEWLRAEFPGVRLIVNEVNRGFARATNQGIRATESAYVATLNNDARPEPGWLSAMVKAMEHKDRVGMVAAQIRFAHRPDRLDSAGIEVDRLGIAWNRRFGQPVGGEPSEVQEVFGPCGAAALYRRAMLEEVGLFDERFFAYYEDVELAWRARRAGWRCLYTPQGRVYHVHSATGGRMPAFKAYHLGRNKWWTLFKHYPFRSLGRWVPLLLISDTVAWLWPLLRRGETAGLRGRWAAFRQREAFLAERDAPFYRASPPLQPPRLRRFLLALFKG